MCFLIDLIQRKTCRVLTRHRYKKSSKKPIV